MISGLICLLLGTPPTLPSESFEEPVVVSQAASDGLQQAQALHNAGVGFYESADYNSAIEKFTEALTLVMSNVQDENSRIKAALLYNIACAHEKQFDIDQDVTHLRQAQTLYEQYLSLDAFEVEEKDDIQNRLQALRVKLHQNEKLLKRPSTQNSEPPAQSTQLSSSPKADGFYKRSRTLGISLSASGGAALLSGVTLLAVGSGFEKKAREQVSELKALSLPPDHPAWHQGDQFITQEKRKGTLLMIVGGVVAAAGVASTSAGVFYLFKARKAKKNLRASLSLSRSSVGVQLSGRF